MKVKARGIIILLVATLCLSACEPDPDENTDAGNDASTTWTPPTPTRSLPTIPLPTFTKRRAIHQVDSRKCPSGFRHGLLISTETAAELEYVTKIVACTTDRGNETYLRNESDATWVLHNLGTVDATAFHWSEGLRIASFRSIAGPEQVVLAPNGIVTATLPPALLEWTIDLPLSLLWEAHELVASRIQSYGEAVLLGALKRTHPAGKALGQCALAVYAYGKTVTGLADKDLSDVLVDGLATGVAGNKCRQQAAEIRRFDSSNRQIVLTQELDNLKYQTKTLETFESRLSTAKQGVRVVKFFNLLLRRG